MERNKCGVSISPKEEQIFQAVIRLIDGGKELSQLTVSEIAGEAGIGKGTTYEYFKSKEEILAKAILYDMALSFHRLESAMRKKKGFREKFRTILDFIEEHCREEKSFTRLMQATQGTDRIPPAVKEEMSRYMPGPEVFYEQIRNFIREGKEEGVFEQEQPDEWLAVALIGHLGMFSMYMGQEMLQGNLSCEEMKYFVCGSFFQSLRT